MLQFNTFPKTHQKWSQWKSGRQEAILKERKRGDKHELCRIHWNELEWKSVSAGFTECWIQFWILFMSLSLYKLEVRRVVQKWVSVKTVEALSVLFEILSKIIELWMQETTVSFRSIMQYYLESIRLATAPFFSSNDCKPTDSYLDLKKET